VVTFLRDDYGTDTPNDDTLNSLTGFEILLIGLGVFGVMINSIWGFVIIVDWSLVIDFISM